MEALITESNKLYQRYKVYEEEWRDNKLNDAELVDN